METVAQLQAMASWRSAVTQGLTLLGFREWVIERTSHAREMFEKRENDLVAGDEFAAMLTVDASQHEAARCVASSIIAGSDSALREPERPSRSGA
jgi:hypothetical protein